MTGFDIDTGSSCNNIVKSLQECSKEVRALNLRVLIFNTEFKEMQKILVVQGDLILSWSSTMS